MRVLLLSEKRGEAHAAAERLQVAGARFDTGLFGEPGLHLAADYGFDLIMVNAGGNPSPSLQMLSALRRSRIDTPVVFVGDSGASDAVVRALEAGADDFIGLILPAAEFTARIRSLVRRAQGIAHPMIEVGDLALDLAVGSVRMGGRPVDLTRTEYAILEAVALRKGEIVSFDAILDRLYGGLGDYTRRTLQAHLCHLRRKLAVVPGGEGYVQSVVGRGLRLGEPLSGASRVAA